MEEFEMASVPESTNRRIHRTGHLIFTSGAVLLLALALGFNLLFNWTALGDLYRDSVANRLERAGRILQRQMEQTVHMGGKSVGEWSSFSNSLKSHARVEQLVRDPEGSPGPDRLFHEVYQAFQQPTDGRGTPLALALSPTMDDFCIALHVKGKTILAVPHGTSVDGLFFGAGSMKSGEAGEGETRSGVLTCSARKGLCGISFPVTDADGTHEVTLSLTVPEWVYSQAVSRARFLAILSAALVFLAGALLLSVLLRRFPGVGAAPDRLGRRRASLIVFVVIASAQVALSGINILAFSNHSWKEARHDAGMAVRLLAAHTEGFLAAGKAERAFPSTEAVMESMVGGISEFSRIRLLDKGGRLIHVTPRSGAKAPDGGLMEEVKGFLGSFFPAILHHEAQSPIVFEGEVKGYVTAWVTPHFIVGKVAKVIADMLTVVLVSILFLVELLILGFELLLEKSGGLTGEGRKRAEIMRPAAFLFVFGIDISVSFLPLHMKGLYRPIMGLSRDFVMGLPISIEFVFVGLTILVAGAWVDRRGWHEPFVAGLSLAAGGVLYSWLAPDAVHFILSRAVAGAGYGLALMASQGFVIHFSDRKSKAHGLAQLFAGIYAGSICGSATGAMLAEKLGYEAVFCIGAAVLAGTLVYTFLFLRGYMRRSIRVPAVAANAVSRTSINGPRRIMNFMSNRTVLSLIFFSSLPASIGVVGLLNYFTPIYLTQMGASQSTIGRVLMLYGISLIYLGPVISRYVDASSDKRLYVFTGCMLGGLTFISFHVLHGIWAAVVAVLILGLSSSFVLASQSAYVLQLPVTRELGEGKAIGIFRSSSRIGQALGPIVFGVVVSGGNISEGIAFFGVMYLITALLFLLMNLRKSRVPVLGEIGGI